MADYKHFRVIVDLSAFFYDHRRVARVFIKSNLKRIADLQNRISEIFEINEFYLTTGDHFLPASEDIRVLNNNENVRVIPNKSQHIPEPSTSPTSQKEHKKRKRTLEIILEEQGETSTPKNKIKNKQPDNIINNSSNRPEDAEPHKKKKTDQNERLVQDKLCFTDRAHTLKKIKKKVKQTSETVDSTHSDRSSEDEVTHKKKQAQSSVEREICNIESSQKIIDIKNKLKQKAQEYVRKHSKGNSVDPPSNMKNVLPKLQTHIKNCNDLGRSTLPDTVRLSRHVDTPIKTFLRYTPPPRITDKYLAKNKVNIVKIDIINRGDEELIGEENMSKNSACSVIAAGVSNENLEETNLFQTSDKSDSPQKNYVKEVINSFEKNISPDSKKDISDQEINEIDDKALQLKESEASNYTKAFLDQRDPNASDNLEFKTDIAANCSVKAVDITPISKTILDGLEHLESINTLQPLATICPHAEKPIKEVESTDTSLDISSIAHDSLLLNGTSNDSSFISMNSSIKLNNLSDKSRNTTTNKGYVGVGLLLERLRESDSVISHESDTSSHYVTKRKRIRKHKRKTKNSNDGQAIAAVKLDAYAMKPLNVKATPKIHIKFEDTEMKTLADMPDIIGNMKTATNSKVNKIEVPKHVDNTQTYDDSENKCLEVETMVVSDENDDPIMENKSIFGEESISKAPLMTNKLDPKVGDIIAFKVLKMTENYSPRVSDYIVGKLEIYLLENKTTYFKILHGENELLPPSGKLSLEEDEYQQKPRYKEFSWTELIEPKLLYP